jgi:hypothetical protein
MVGKDESVQAHRAGRRCRCRRGDPGARGGPLGVGRGSRCCRSRVQWCAAAREDALRPTAAASASHDDGCAPGWPPPPPPAAGEASAFRAARLPCGCVGDAAAAEGRSRPPPGDPKGHRPHERWGAPLRVHDPRRGLSPASDEARPERGAALQARRCDRGCLLQPSAWTGGRRPERDRASSDPRLSLRIEIETASTATSAAASSTAASTATSAAAARLRDRGRG